VRQPWPAGEWRCTVELHRGTCPRSSRKSMRASWSRPAGGPRNCSMRAGARSMRSSWRSRSWRTMPPPTPASGRTSRWTARWRYSCALARPVKNAHPRCVDASANPKLIFFAAQCDASIMCGEDMAFGAVAAASAIKNPIAAAAALLYKGREGLQDLGRVPPLVLVGEGARSWCEKEGIPVCRRDAVDELVRQVQQTTCTARHRS